MQVSGALRLIGASVVNNRLDWGNPWLERVLRFLDADDRPACVLGPPDAGFRQIGLGLDKADRPLVWVDLSGDSVDEVDAGVRVSDAFRLATNVQLIPYGLSIASAIDLLDGYVEALGPFVFVFMGADSQPDAWRKITSLHRRGSRVVICAARVPESISLAELNVLSRPALELTYEEAVAVSQGHLAPAELEQVLVESGGMYESFRKRLSQHRGLPSQVAEVVRSDIAALIESGEADAGEIVWALYRRRRYVEAFHLACVRTPDQVWRLVEECGEAYFQRGLFDRFFTLISRLPDELLRDESILRWRFSAAMALNRHHEVVPLVERFLDTNEAPELRAQYAAARPSSDFLEQTSRAVAAKRSPVTLRHHAFALSLEGKVAESLETSRRALRLADLLGQSQLVVGIATDISTSLVRKGDLADAVWWAEWACAQYFELGLNEHFRRLSAVAALVYPKVLLGDEVRLADLAAELGVSHEFLGVPSYEGVVSTAADYQSVLGDVETASELYRSNFDAASYEQAASASVDLVRCLCDLGRYEEAVEIGRSVTALARGASGYEQGCAWLAAGIAYRAAGLEDALACLLKAQSAFSKGFDAVRGAQTAVQLGLLHVAQGDLVAASRSLEIAGPTLRQLGWSGWLLLGGRSPGLDELRQLVEPRPVVLELDLLGEPSVALGASDVSVGGRSLEILTILAANPTGLSGEILATQLYGDRVVMNTFKATISRLRSLIPIDSRPYRIAVEYRADFVEVRECLRRGQVRQAVSLYRGPLLPTSSAPAIEELRGQIEEELRQAALQSEDVEVVLELIRRTKEDDLELLERAYQLVSRNDPQSPLLRARIRQLQRDWESEAGAF